MSNLPPGCSESEIERHAEGSCSECGRTLRDGYCRTCDAAWCDKCERMVDFDECVLIDGQYVCEKCASKENEE